MGIHDTRLEEVAVTLALTPVLWVPFFYFVLVQKYAIINVHEARNYMNKRFLMYGAGSIGRGFIGPLFASAGFQTVFIDINRQIIDAMNRCHAYRISVAAEPPYMVPVEGVRCVDGTDEKAVLEEIASCSLMAVSIGPAALQRAAPLIARGFSLRMKRTGEPLNIIVCENLKNAQQLLYGWLGAALPEEDKPLLDTRCGLIEAAVGRMVPALVPDEDEPLRVTVEEYGFLPMDRTAFIGEPPIVNGLVPYAPFGFYEERKLYLHNMGHASCAYLGMLKGCDTIAQAVSDPYIRLFVQSAMTEAAAMLSAKYNVPFADIFNHGEDLLLRFGNAALGDTCGRVGRDPMRKLQAGDRFAGALGECYAQRVYPVYIALSFAAALHTVTSDEARAKEIVKDNSRLPDKQADLVMMMFPLVELSSPELLRAAERIKKEMRGNTV